jgi:hypothetical protein
MLEQPVLATLHKIRHYIQRIQHVIIKAAKVLC